MHSIKQYITEVPNGYNILSEKVSRIFPTDDSQPRLPGEVDQPLYDVMQEALNISKWYIHKHHHNTVEFNISTDGQLQFSLHFWINAKKNLKTLMKQVQI